MLSLPALFQWCAMSLLLSCGFSSAESVVPIHSSTNKVLTYSDSLREQFKSHPLFIAKGFDFPVGKPNAKGYYNAQPFGKNNHLGDDWNGNGGGNSDLGDPVYSIADGLVTQSINYFGGWGKVIRVLHAQQVGDSLMLTESLYAHLQEMTVKKNDWVKRGDLIGRIGNAEGIYLAHLHFEIREDPTMSIGNGYSSNTEGYKDPTKFIKSHRSVH